MKTKNKLMLLGFTGASAIGALAPLAVTSCSNAKKVNIVNHVSQSSDDIKYGISEKTFNTLKSDYSVQYKQQMITSGIQEGSDAWNLNMDKLNAALNTFTTCSENYPMSYTQLTNAVIDHARKFNGITLRRVSTATFSDIEDEFQGAVESFKDYGQHHHLPTSQVKKVVDTATASYKAKLEQLTKEGYRQNDPYGALLKVRADLFDFFSSGNAIIAKFAAMNKLANYQNQYTFSYREKTDTAYLENVKNTISEKGIEVGADMSSIFDDIFEVYDTEKNVKLDKFDPAAIPGYTITPIYQGIETNELSNSSKVKFSLNIISNEYLNTNDEQETLLATACKLSVPEDEQHFVSEVKKLDTKGDVFTNEYFACFDKVKESRFGFFGPNQEKTQLEATYFDDTKEQHITFNFPEANERTKYEAFFTSVSAGDNAYVLGKDDLANVGVQISDGQQLYYLADVINSINAKKKVEGFNPETDLTFVEQFVYFNDINAVSTILDKTTHYVSTDIKVKYSNSLNENASQHVINSMTCTGYKISPEEFMKMSKDYTAASNVYSFYANNDVHKWMIADATLTAFNTLSGAIGLLCTAYWGVRLVSDIKSGWWKANLDPDTAVLGRASRLSKLRCVLGLTSFKYLCCAVVDLGLSAALAGISGSHLDKSKELDQAIRGLMSEEYVKSLQPIMDEGKEVFIKLTGPDRNEYDEIERQTKYEKFSLGDYVHYQYLDNTFKSIVSKGSEFDKLVKKHKVPMEDVVKYLKDRSWADNKEKWIWMLAGELTVLVLDVFLAYVTIWDIIKNSAAHVRGPHVHDEASMETDQMIADVGTYNGLQLAALEKAGADVTHNVVVGQVVDFLWALPK